MAGRIPVESLDTLLASQRTFLAFLRKRTGSREDAEEILQSAFARALEKGGELRRDESVVAWFYRLLRNSLVDHWRRKAAGKRALAARASESAAESSHDPALEKAVCACVKRLIPLIRPEYATLIARVDLGSQEVAAAGRDLGLSAGNARVRLHRARAALRREVVRACGTCAEHGCIDCSCGETHRS